MNEEMLNALMGIIRSHPCEVTYAVKKKPKGVHITIDVTKEEMEEIMKY